MGDDLDSLVKGAPQPGRAPVAGLASGGGVGGGVGGGTSPIAASAAVRVGDPLSHTPSSPSMIYLNLLVLEASLRAQYLALRARRRHHTFFLLLLSAWILGFGYALFLAPREDGSGVGGSVYWVVDVLEKVCFMGGGITAALVWATGIWDRGVRWPRRWFSVSNRGLRHINCKLVLLKRPWWAEALATLAWFLTYGLLSSDAGGASSYRHVEPALLREVDRELNLNTAGGHHHPGLASYASHAAAAPGDGRDEEKGGSGGASLGRVGGGTRLAGGHLAAAAASASASAAAGHEEDLAPGGDYVKLLLLAKPFSPTFRENWELYRQEYWDRENERRALVRRKLKEQDRARRRSAGGWLWWLPGRSVPAAAHSSPSSHHHQHHPSHGGRPHTPRGGGSGGGGFDSFSEKAHPQHPRHAAVEREHRRTRSNSSSMRRGSTSLATAGSGGSSSGSTPLPPGAATGPGGRSATPTRDLEDGDGGVTRKASTSSSTSERRRKKSTAAAAGGSGGGTGAGSGSGAGAGASSSGRWPNAGDGRSVTPDIPSPLAKESSFSEDGRRGS